MRLSSAHLWWILPPLTTLWMSFMHPARRLDFWWHLKVGELIVQWRRIPQTDIFSFTRAGQPFLYQNWLAEVCYYLAYRTGGLPLLIAFNAFLLLLALLGVYGLCRRATDSRQVSILAALIAAVALGVYSNARPQVFSFVLFAAFYFILWSYREGHSDSLWVLPPLMVLWVNLHGAFVLGLAMMALLLVLEALRSSLRPQQARTLSAEALRKLGLVLVLAVAATLLNPAGAGVWAYVRQLQVDPASQGFVREWQAPDVKELSGVLLFFGPFLISLLVFVYSRIPLDLTELGLFLAFAFLGLASRRNGIWFSLTAAPLVARHAVRWRRPPALERMGGSQGSGVKRRRAELRWLNWALLLALLAFTVLLSPWVRPHLRSPRLRLDLIEEDTPVAAMDYIESQGLEGHIFHPQAYGDYLIWRLWPQQHSFIDGRVHLYDDDLVRDYILAFQDEHWESRLAKYDIQNLLLSKRDSNSEMMIQDARASDHWSLLYEDQDTVLFARRP